MNKRSQPWQSIPSALLVPWQTLWRKLSQFLAFSVAREPGSKTLKRFPKMLITTFFVTAIIMVSANLVLAGDPGGGKTGVGTDALDAQGSAIILTEPADKGDAAKMKAYQEFKGKADKEPLAAQLAEAVGQNRIAINLVWTLITGFLVMFMQAGFALVETGFTRAKNAVHTMLMNFLVYVIGLTGFWIAGFALMFGAMPVGTLGGTSGLDAKYEVVLNLFGKPFGLFATNGFFLGGDVYDVGVYTIFLFQMVFMDTAVTIPTGSMCERWNLKSFYIFMTQ